MSIDAIEKIKNAEAEALAITDSAKAEAAEMIAAAKTEQAETLARARKLADDRALKERNNAVNAANEIIVSATDEAKKEADELIEKAGQKMPAAVSLVIMEIFKKWQ